METADEKKEPNVKARCRFSSSSFHNHLQISLSLFTSMSMIYHEISFFLRAFQVANDAQRYNVFTRAYFFIFQSK